MGDEKDMNRRRALKKVGMGSIFALGATGPVNATQKVNPDRVDSLLKSQKVRSIENSLPNLQLQKQRAEVIEAGPKDNPTSITKTEVPSNLGLLNIVEFSEIGQIEVLFEFKNYRPNLNFDWPRGTEARLRGTEEEAILVRGASKQETKKVARIIGIDEDGLIVGTTSEMDGFKAHYIDSENKTLEEFYVTEHDIKNPSTSKVEQISYTVPNEQRQGLVTTASSCDCGEMFAHIVLCLNDLGVCSLYLSSVVGGPAATVACVVATGCVSIADIWLGCTTLISDRDCLYECVASA